MEQRARGAIWLSDSELEARDLIRDRAVRPWTFLVVNI